MVGSRKGVRLLDFEGRYGDDPFSKPRRVGSKVVDVYKGLSEQGGRRRRKAGFASSFVRAAGGSPEAVVKLASWGSGASSARDQLDYISREGDLTLEMSDGTTLETREEIRELVDDWSDRFSHRKDGKARNTVHLVLSTPPGTDRDAALAAGRDWSEETFGDKHEYVLVRHDDTDHPHVHIVAEVKGRDRSRFTVGPSDFHDMRERFAEKCRDRGIEMNATRRDVRGAARGESMALRKMREAGRTPRIDDIARRQVAEQGAGRQGGRVHPAKALRQERLEHVAGEHRALAHRLSMGDLAVWDAGRSEQIAAAKALNRLAGHLERGGDTARPDRVHGAERAEREGGPRGDAEGVAPTAPVERVAPPDGVERRAALSVEDIDKARGVASEMVKQMPPGAQRETVLAQIATLDKARKALQERAEEQGAEQGGVERSDAGSALSEARAGVAGPEQGQRPLTNTERDLLEIRERQEKREKAQRGAGEPDKDRADRDIDRDR